MNNDSTIVEEDEDYPGSNLWIFIDSFVIIAIVFGNVLTISAVIASKKLSALIANQFIVGLAISDFLVGATFPYHMYFYIDENFGKEKHKCLVRFVLISFACANSMCNLICIATDRYIAIIHPFRYNRCMTRKFSLALIAIGWVAALTLSTMPIYWNNWVDGIRTCDTEHILPDLYFHYVLTPMFSLVWVAMIFVYVKIGREARDHNRRIRTATQNLMSTGRDTKSIQVVMLTLGCFSVCWMPYFIVTTYYRINVADDDQETSGRFNLYYEIAFTLAAGNSGMNPVIYAWKNSNFREAFWCLLRCQSPNQATKKIGYITNHVPSNKNSIINGDSGGNKHDGACDGSSIEIEMDRQKEIDDYNSCSTDMSNVASIRGA